MATVVESLPSQMEAVQIVGFHVPPEIRRIEVPTIIKPHEMLIKVAVSGICHTDLEFLKGTFDIEMPVTGSHEATGTVVAFGSDIKGFKVGERVLAGQTHGRCGKCDVCKGPENFSHYCPNREHLMGFKKRNGAWQEYLVFDGREACHIPDEMAFVTATPLACAGATAYRAVNLCQLKPGEWIGIVGSGGGLGHLAIQFAKARGLKVVGVEARDEGIKLSKEFGADVVIDIRKGMEAAMEEAQKATGAGGAHVSLVLSDHRTAAKTACAITRNHGTVVQVAVLEPVEFSWSDIIVRDIRIRGSSMASHDEFQQMLYDVVKYNIKVENNVFHGLHETPRVLDLLRDGKYSGKAVIVVDEEEFKKDVDNKRT